MSSDAHVDRLDMVPLGGRMLTKRSPASKALRAATLTAILALIALVLALGRPLCVVPPKVRCHNHIGSAFNTTRDHDLGDQSIEHSERSTSQAKIAREFEFRDSRVAPSFRHTGLVRRQNESLDAKPRYAWPNAAVLAVGTAAVAFSDSKSAISRIASPRLLVWVLMIRLMQNVAAVKQSQKQD